MSDAIEMDAVNATPDLEINVPDINDLKQLLMQLFKTEGIDFGDGDYCSIIEAVENVMPIGELHHLSDNFSLGGTEKPLQVYIDALEKIIRRTMPDVVVSLVRDRKPDLAERHEEEKLLELAKLLLTMSHPSPRAAVEAIEASLAKL